MASSSMKTTSGFTLIELLIVVAIIGILAAIAVPNFLNAQIKAKVARAQSDLRSMATAIEMYTLDNNAPPPSTNPSMTASDTTYGYMRFNLTTPVAYLSSGLLPDPFVDQWDEETQRNDELYYTYHNLKMLTDHSLFPEYMEDFYGPWRALSYGPDKTYANGTYGVRIYDTSNGVLSFGNIIISQKYQTVKDIPDALK